MKVLVTGAGGQLGLDLLDAFDEHDVIGLAQADLDVADEAAVVAAVRDHEPDLLVHAGAWTDVDGCERDPGRAHQVNALGTWWVARACQLIDAAVAYISTDYVFDGQGRRDAGGDLRPYTEFDPTLPLNSYGRSKEAGEQLVRQTLAEHYIVRTSWLCGARGRNFVRTMLRLGEERGRTAPINVVDDQVGSPTFTRDLAAAIRELGVTGRFGTYHRTNRGTCSWYEFAAAIFELAGLDVDLRPSHSNALDRPAPRPAYSVLSDRHSVLSGLKDMPHWREGLARLLEELRG
ncbi:MAG: dTDP-4-dehydrorhamnose reductase [Actinomycetota bacterium]|nr:dTDP-4-dehydrorhamnose reductase [Actinomycetota bacterium]